MRTSDRADLHEIPVGDRLRKIEAELQHLKMLMTQVVKHLGLQAVSSIEAMMALKDKDPD
jgi:hypothetical protein